MTWTRDEMAASAAPEPRRAEYAWTIPGKQKTGAALTIELDDTVTSAAVPA